MARKGSTKELSVRQEEFIARIFEGARSPSSGASVTDQGDVRDPDTLFECKLTGSEASPLKRVPTLVAQMEKIADEAWSEGREPALALRFYLPDSVLSGNDGWIDLVVRTVGDDAHRSLKLRERRRCH